jgi:hypothetical protein
MTLLSLAHLSLLFGPHVRDHGRRTARSLGTKGPKLNERISQLREHLPSGANAAALHRLRRPLAAMTDEPAGGAKWVFHFDVQGSVPKSASVSV